MREIISEIEKVHGRRTNLSKPMLGENLYIYLALSDLAVSSILIREEDRVQKLIYCMSHALLDAETRYLMVEKMALALVIFAKK